MTKEIWKDIPGYDGLYKVSNLGRIYSYHKKDFKSLELNKKGYQIIRPYKNSIRKTFRIHRLVCELFIENPQNKPQVNHKDGNKENNHYLNLEWCTQKENSKHAIKTGLHCVGEQSPFSKMTDEKVKEMRKLYSEGIGSTTLGKIYGINEKNAYNIVKYKSWRHVS